MTAFPTGYHDAVALDQIHESPWNPRKTFDPAKLAELGESLKEKGCLTPLIVRPRKAGGVEIGAGHRRRRAAELAKLPALPVVVRALSDLDFLELLVIENDQREDVHELEQAEGYKRLMLQDGYSAKRIADKVGRSEKYVYDRLKLLALIPLAQKLFLAGKMTAGHAILLARLTPKDQERALEIDDSYRGRGGVFESEGGDLLADEKPAKGPLAEFEGVKPVSVRELNAWIDTNVRFDPKKADPFLFPTVVTAVEAAPKDLVPLTREHHVPDEARDGKVRTYGPASWKEATKACKFTQPGIIVVGEGRGDVLQVCLSSHRDACATHWAKEKKDAEARRKMMARGGSTRRADNTFEKQEERRKTEEAKQAALRARYKTALPAIFTALVAAIEKAPLSQIAAPLVARLSPDRWSRQLLSVEKYSTPGKTAESILRHLAVLDLTEDCTVDYRIVEGLAREGKRWGVNVQQILDKEAPAPKPEAAAKDKPKKKAAKR